MGIQFSSMKLSFKNQSKPVPLFVRELHVNAGGQERDSLLIKSQSYVSRTTNG